MNVVQRKHIAKGNFQHVAHSSIASTYYGVFLISELFVLFPFFSSFFRCHLRVNNFFSPEALNFMIKQRLNQHFFSHFSMRMYFVAILSSFDKNIRIPSLNANFHKIGWKKYCFESNKLENDFFYMP